MIPIVPIIGDGCEIVREANRVYGNMAVTDMSDTDER